LSMFCSLLSIVMVITILSLCWTLHLRTQLANTLVTSLQQSIWSRILSLKPVYRVENISSPRFSTVQDVCWVLVKRDRVS
jgi:ABC-type siderophore export system fused ATPase/permease subunit